MAAQSSNASLLHRLGVKYGTDKADAHNYLVVYDEVFSPLRESVHRMLEIGVYRGSSILMWRDYFTNAEVVGMDIFSKIDIKSQHIAASGRWNSFFNAAARGDHGPRVKAVKCNSSKESHLRRFIDGERRNATTFDLIIEDGSHMQRDQHMIFARLFPLVKPGGIYVIEDLQSGWTTGFDEPKASENTTVQMLSRLQQFGRIRPNKYINDTSARYLEQWIESVQVVAPPKRVWTRHLTSIVHKRLARASDDVRPRVDIRGFSGIDPPPKRTPSIWHLVE